MVTFPNNNSKNEKEGEEEEEGEEEAAEEEEDEGEELTNNLSERAQPRYSYENSYKRPLKHFPASLNIIEEVDECSAKSSDTSRSIEKATESEAAKSKVDEESKEIREHESIVCEQQSRNKSLIEKSDGSPQKVEFSSECRDQDIPEVRKHDQDEDYYLNSQWDHPRRQRPKSAGYSMQTQHYIDWATLFGSNGKCGIYLYDYPARPRSACSMRPRHELCINTRTKRSSSQPNITRTSATWEVNRFKRSLRLLGLSQSDFGIPESPKQKSAPVRTLSCHASPTFQTRVLRRSVSLEFLRTVIRSASRNSSPGLPERQLLATAAYEEWYFKKSEETKRKQMGEKLRYEQRLRRIEEENRKKQEKANEQFCCWIAKKKVQAEKAKLAGRVDAQTTNRLRKTQEEIDKVYKDWKSRKSQDLSLRQKREKEEAENQLREEERKTERRIQAEKVFQDWRKRLEEREKNKKMDESKAHEKFNSLISNRKSNTPFLKWKAVKDDEMKMKWRKDRNAAKMAKTRLTIHLTERMYEAEQAFEDWLDKVDSRHSKKKPSDKHLKVPWTPV